MVYGPSLVVFALSTASMILIPGYSERDENGVTIGVSGSGSVQRQKQGERRLARQRFAQKEGHVRHSGSKAVLAGKTASAAEFHLRGDHMALEAVAAVRKRAVSTETPVKSSETQQSADSTQFAEVDKVVQPTSSAEIATHASSAMQESPEALMDSGLNSAVDSSPAASVSTQSIDKQASSKPSLPASLPAEKHQAVPAEMAAPAQAPEISASSAQAEKVVASVGTQLPASAAEQVHEGGKDLEDAAHQADANAISSADATSSSMQQVLEQIRDEAAMLSKEVKYSVDLMTAFVKQRRALRQSLHLPHPDDGVRAPVSRLQSSADSAAQVSGSSEFRTRSGAERTGQTRVLSSVNLGYHEEEMLRRIKDSAEELARHAATSLPAVGRMLATQVQEDLSALHTKHKEAGAIKQGGISSEGTSELQVSGISGMQAAEMQALREIKAAAEKLSHDLGQRALPAEEHRFDPEPVIASSILATSSGAGRHDETSAEEVLQELQAAADKLWDDADHSLSLLSRMQRSEVSKPQVNLRHDADRQALLEIGDVDVRRATESLHGGRADLQSHDHIVKRTGQEHMALQQVETMTSSLEGVRQAAAENINLMANLEASRQSMEQRLEQSTALLETTLSNGAAAHSALMQSRDTATALIRQASESLAMAKQVESSRDQIYGTIQKALTMMESLGPGSQQQSELAQSLKAEATRAKESSTVQARQSLEEIKAAAGDLAKEVDRRLADMEKAADQAKHEPGDASQKETPPGASMLA